MPNCLRAAVPYAFAAYTWMGSYVYIHPIASIYPLVYIHHNFLLIYSHQESPVLQPPSPVSPRKSRSLPRLASCCSTSVIEVCCLGSGCLYTAGSCWRVSPKPVCTVSPYVCLWAPHTLSLKIHPPFCRSSCVLSAQQPQIRAPSKATDPKTSTISLAAANAAPARELLLLLLRLLPTVLQPQQQRPLPQSAAVCLRVWSLLRDLCDCGVSSGPPSPNC